MSEIALAFAPTQLFTNDAADFSDSSSGRRTPRHRASGACVRSARRAAGRADPRGAPPRGAMIERSEHPEWPQFLMLAAIRRAVELEPLARTARHAGASCRLRGPRRAEQRSPGSPPCRPRRDDADPEDDDQAGRSMQPPAATIPIEIGEDLDVRIAGGDAGGKTARGADAAAGRIAQGKPDQTRPPPAPDQPAGESPAQAAVRPVRVLVRRSKNQTIAGARRQYRRPLARGYG